MFKATSINDLFTELAKVEVALMWAEEFHKKQAEMFAASHASWQVKYPPIVGDLQAAVKAAANLREHFEGAKRVEDTLKRVLGDSFPDTVKFADKSAAPKPEEPSWVKAYNERAARLAAGKNKL